MRAYKFLPARFASDFATKGILRIGTAGSFRVDDGVAGGRNDTEEFSHRFQPGPLRIKAAKIPALKRMLEENGSLVDESVVIAFEDGASIVFETDCYIFCASSKITRRLAVGMAEKFGCDACVRISDVRQFAQILTEHCENLRYSGIKNVPIGAFDFGVVRYLPVDPTIPGDIDPLRKRREFRWQNEVRIIWPKAPPLEPFIVEIHELTKLLKMVPLPI